MKYSPSIKLSRTLHMLKNRMSLSADNRFIHHIEPNVVIFPFMYYPFPNGIVTYQYFKTILCCESSQQAIQKAIKIKLNTMISLKRVIKTNKKPHVLQNVKLTNSEHQHQNFQGKSQNFYSFYYEIIPFSLISVLKGQAGPCCDRILKKIDKIFIKKQITKLVSDLQKMGVFYLLKLQNIGVTLTGNIKVYVAPNIMLGNIKLTQKQKVVILQYLLQSLKQIDVQFGKVIKKNEQQCSIGNILPIQFSIQQSYLKAQNSQNYLKTQNLFKRQNNNSSIFIIKNQQRSFGQQQQNFIRHPGSTNNLQVKMKEKAKEQFKKTNYMGRSQQSIKSNKQLFYSSIINVKHQKNKIQQISKQIEQIRKKIKQKAETKKIKPKDQLNEGNGNQVQKVTMNNSPLKSSQNNLAINLIEKQLKKNIIQEQIQMHTKIKKKRKSSQSSINFYQGQIPAQHNINCINIYHHNSLPFHPSHFIDHDNASCDTYQMEIGQDMQMPKVPLNNNGFRSTFTPNKRHVQKQQPHPFNQPFNSHVQKKPFYESAGNKMFSHIVNNLIKPQFLPKKSNIYQDVEEQQTQKSVSIKKSKSKIESSQKIQIKNVQVKQQKKEVAKNAIQNIEINSNSKDKINRMKSLDEFKMHIIGFKNMKKPSMAKNQEREAIQFKVKSVLEKTKNAIAILNKVKSKFKSTSIQKNKIGS